MSTAPDKPDLREERRFGEWLVERSVVSAEQIAEALEDQTRRGGRLGEVLVRLGLVSEAAAADALAGYLSVERIELADMTAIDLEVARSIPESLAKRFCLMAVRREGDGGIAVAMADPLDIVARDTVALRLGRAITVAMSTAREITHAIESVFHGSDIQEKRIRDLLDVVATAETGEGAAEEDDAAITDITGEAAANKAPVIRFVDLLLSQAVKSRASDIHIEPQEKNMAIRMRVDGMLREMTAPSRRMQPAVIARVKILAGMDIAERRLPQDGRLTIKAPGRDIDLRASSIPTIHGEKVVLRILDKAAVNHDLDELGFEPDALDLFKRNLSQPHGIIVVTGPTGSGKSTTLYAANFVKDPSKNITTVENPVEYRLGGINQIQTKAEIGLTFATCLRTILRQDPDIILIGEIRDKETMEIAIQASLTGHLVLSTFHTNDAPSALSRLSYMGLERYLLASSLNLIIAQRLVRRICVHCAEPAAVDPAILRRLRLDPARLDGGTLSRGKGCKLCSWTGYAGRMPIFEFLPLDGELRELVSGGASEARVRAHARAAGFGGLLESGTRRMLEGVTTADEVLRVTFLEEPNPSRETAAA